MEKLYQYALTKKEMCQIIVSCNYEILDVHYFSVVKGLKDELSWMNKLHRCYRVLSKRPVLCYFPVKAFNLLFKLLERSHFLQQNCSHMIMIAARRPCEP